LALPDLLHSRCMVLPDKLIAQALALPASERAELAHRLLESLHEDDEPGADETWNTEVVQVIDRRAREVLAGEVEMVDGEDVIRRARERLRSR
jgi:hypothetical protein